MSQVEDIDEPSLMFFLETAKPGSKVPLPVFDKDGECRTLIMNTLRNVGGNTLLCDGRKCVVTNGCYLPPGDVLLFLKRYDPRTSSITYAGHIYWPISRSVGKSQ